MNILCEISAKAEKIIEYLEKTQLSFKTIFFSILTIISVRFFLESAFLNLQPTSYEEFIASFATALLLFFLFSYVLLVIFVFLLTGEKISRVASIVLWGQWLVILPPIVDFIVFEGRPVWSFYIFDSVQGSIMRFFTFFGDNPAFGITYGTRVEVLLVVILLGFYVFIKKGKKIKWLIAGSFLTYVLMFSLAIIPNLITYFHEVVLGKDLLEIGKRDIVRIFLTSLKYFEVERGTFKTVLSFKMAFFFNIFLFVELLVLQFIVNKKKFWALLGNIRYPQMFFNSGLMLMGVGLGAFYFPQNFSLDMFSVLAVVNLWIGVFSAWYFSVFINDITDLETDKISNSSRPLASGTISHSEFEDYSFVFLILSLSSAIVVSDKVFLLMAVYLLITWAYSQTFRLKRFIIIASFLSSFASLLFLLMGFVIVSEGQSLTFFPWRIIFFLFFSYAFLIPIKDLKDIEGDRKAGTITLPVLVGEKRARMILGSILFLAYFASVIILNEQRLLFPAVLFGMISYSIMTNKKYKTRALPWWVLGIVMIYGIILVLITFG